MRLILLVALLVWPLLEIAAFVVVGRAIGVWPTLGLVILTAAAGALMLRRQGLDLLGRLSQQTSRGELPAAAVIDGAMIVFAGLLLLLPGFLTDVIGLILFIPSVRRLLWSRLGRRIVVRASSSGGFRRPTASPFEPDEAGSSKIVDLDDDDFRRDGPSHSPWIRKSDDDR